MSEFPTTFSEFQDQFVSDEACLHYLEKIRWPDGFSCSNCRHGKYRRTKRGLLQCQECRYQCSVTAGTIFHNTRKPIRLWFEAIWHITNQKYGANALGLQRIFSFGSYNTAWQWLHKLRRAMVRPGREKLSGFVEIDETYIGGERSGKRGRGSEGKAIVVVAVEDKSPIKKRGIGRVRLQNIQDASADSLIDFIKNNVDHGSVIRTDGWAGYQSLQSIGYGHIIEDSKDLRIAHLVVSLLKRWLLGTYQGAVRECQLAYYLDEYTFRFNRRTSASRGKLFYRLIQQAVMADPVTLDQLKGYCIKQNHDSNTIVNS